MIKDLQTLKQFLKQNINFPIFGAGVYAFYRLGPEDFLPDYRILSLRRSLDGELIKKNIKTLFIEKSLGRKHIKAARNATTLLTHPKTKKYLDKFNRQDILVYKTSSKMEKYCKEENWNLMIPPKKFGKDLFENKIKFRQILEELDIAVPPGRITDLEDLHYGHLINSYGLPFVIQHPTKGGGKGTFFINNKEEYDKVYNQLKNPTRLTFLGIEKPEKPPVEVIIAEYIKGPSPSITGCVTRHGVISTNLQHQILDIPELYSPNKGSGLFCGHDWTFSNFPKEIEKQAYEINERVGNYLKNLGYKGIFGLDFVMDQEKLYVTEMNPRLLGSFPVLTMVQLKNNEPPILAFHILEYLNIDYQMDLQAINRLMRQKKQGAHMLSHNLTGHWTRIHGNVKAGVYKLENNRLKFLREGYKLQHLKNEEEFVIAEGILIKKSHLSPNRRICRVMCLKNVLENHKELTPWAKTVVKELYRAFKLKPIFLLKLRKIFNPNILAKG